MFLLFLFLVGILRRFLKGIIGKLFFSLSLSLSLSLSVYWGVFFLNVSMHPRLYTYINDAGPLPTDLPAVSGGEVG